MREEQRGPQIFLSRTHPLFMAKLFAQEVPEIYDGVIEIKSVARDPGSRAKIAVVSNDSSIDPVGACVGMRGSRVQAVVGELQGEKIDIIPWSADPATFVVNALAPAEVARSCSTKKTTAMDVVVPDSNCRSPLAAAGRMCASVPCLRAGISIFCREEESERRQQEALVRTTLFVEALAVDDVIAHLLVTEGFTKVEQIADISLDELAETKVSMPRLPASCRSAPKPGWPKTPPRWKPNAKSSAWLTKSWRCPACRSKWPVKLAKRASRRFDDVADLASDELREIIGTDHLTEGKANEIIMAARRMVYEDAAGKDPSAPA